MINLMRVISTYYPTIQCVIVGDPNIYTNIDWLNTPVENIPTEQDLLDKNLELYKAEKIISLSNQCGQSIISGFISNALGHDHMYDGEEVDQINILGAVQATEPSSQYPLGTSIEYACRHIPAMNKTYEVHTHNQIRQVLLDGASIKLAKLQQFNGLRDQVNACTTYAQIDAIEWVDP